MRLGHRAILGVDDLGPEPRLLQPGRRRVAQALLHAGADEPVAARLRVGLPDDQVDAVQQPPQRLGLVLGADAGPRSPSSSLGPTWPASPIVTRPIAREPPPPFTPIPPAISRNSHRKLDGAPSQSRTTAAVIGRIEGATPARLHPDDPVLAPTLAQQPRQAPPERRPVVHRDVTGQRLARQVPRRDPQQLPGRPVRLPDHTRQVRHQIAVRREVEQVLVPLPLRLDRLPRLLQLVGLLPEFLLGDPQLLHRHPERLGRLFPHRPQVATIEAVRRTELHESSVHRFKLA